MLSRWWARLTGRERDVHTSDEDVADMVRAKYEASRLRDEAQELLDDAHSNAEMVRDDKREDHYIEIIDALFRGERNAAG